MQYILKVEIVFFGLKHTALTLTYCDLNANLILSANLQAKLWR